MLNIYYLRMLKFVRINELQQLLWSSVISNLSKLLETNFDEEKVREVLELVLVLDDEHKNNITTLVQLLSKYM